MSTSGDYSIATRNRALELIDSRVWTRAQVQQILAREGHRVPAVSTFARWMAERESPAAAARARQRDRDAKRQRWAERSAQFCWPARVSAEWKLGRMKALRKIGVSNYDIARIMNHDFPGDEPLTEGRVRATLKRVGVTKVLPTSGCKVLADVKPQREDADVAA